MTKIIWFCVVTLLTACGGGGGSNSPKPNDPPERVAINSGGDVSNQAISVSGTTREYSLYRPSNPARKKLPLVIVFHGAGGVVWPNIKDDYWVKIASRESFYLLQPQAVNDENTSYSYWNVGLVSSRDDVDFVKTALDLVISQEDIDTDRIYVSGMSSGGHMAFFFGLAQQDRLAAIASIAGSIATTPNILGRYDFRKPMPLCHIHGTADTIVNINGGSWYASWNEIINLWLDNNRISNPPAITELANNSLSDNSTVTKFEYRGATKASDIDDYRVNGGAHSVPGIEFSANQDFNAYETIWSFFKNHALTDPY